MSRKPLVKVLNLGLIKYRDALQIQTANSKNLIDDHPDKRINKLIFVEHYPIYTIGIRSKQYTEDFENSLIKSGADFYRSNRGGLITFHGLGQLVVYPIFHLKDFNLTLRNYVDQLQNVVIDTASKFGLKAYTCEHIGVWVDDKKLAAVGIHASHFVTTHGFGLNCNTDLGWFDRIVPCGIHDKEVTSLTRELNRDVSIKEAKPAVLESFKKVFNCDIV